MKVHDLLHIYKTMYRHTCVTPLTAYTIESRVLVHVSFYIHICNILTETFFGSVYCIYTFIVVTTYKICWKSTGKLKMVDQLDDAHIKIHVFSIL